MVEKWSLSWQIVSEKTKYCSNLKDDDNNFITDPNEINDAWTEYFWDLLNVENEVTTEEANEPHPNQNHEEMEITREELDRAIKEMKANKATGVDDFAIELLKNTSENVKIWLLKFINIIWKEGA